jgi:hypothetical protein
MAARQTAATRCAIHEEWISEIKGTLTGLRVQAQAHTDGLSQLVDQRRVQNGRLEKLEMRVWAIIIALAALLGGSGVTKALAMVSASMGK